MKNTLALLIVLSCSLSSAKAQEVVNGNQVFVPGSGNQVQCTNDGTTGTTINLLAKAASTGCIKAATTDTNVPVWIVTSASATTGNASLAFGGQASCIMDTTIASGAEGDYVIESTTTGGQCHPQSAQPTGVFIIGTLISGATTSGSVATVQVISSFNPAGGAGSSFDPATGVLLYDDFVGNNITTGQVSILGWGIGATSPSYVSPDVAGTYGVIQIPTSASSGNISNLFLVNRHYEYDTAVFDSKFRFQMETVTTLRTDFAGFTTIGATAGEATTDFIGCAYAAATDTNYMYVLRKASGTELRVSSGLAADTNFHTCRIRALVAGTISFSIDGGTETCFNSGGTGGCTATTQIPSVTLSPFYSVTTNTTAVRTIAVDYFWHTITGLSR
jgi:hypothetical protein